MKKKIDQEVNDYCKKLVSNLTDEEKHGKRVDLKKTCKKLGVKATDEDLTKICREVGDDLKLLWIEKLDKLLKWLVENRGLENVHITSFDAPDRDKCESDEDYEKKRNVWREKVCAAMFTLIELEACGLLEKASCDCI